MEGAWTLERKVWSIPPGHNMRAASHGGWVIDELNVFIECVKGVILRKHYHAIQRQVIWHVIRLIRTSRYVVRQYRNARNLG